MADRFKPLPIFPTLVHGFHLPNFKTDKDKFVKYIEEQRVKDPAGVQISNGGGWQSQATQSGQRSKLTTTLKKAILNYFDDPEIFNKSGKVKIAGMWLNINSNDNFNFPHPHAGAEFAGVCWIQANPHSGKLVLNAPTQFSQWDEWRIYSESAKRFFRADHGYEVEPLEGLVVIFPACLYHLVLPNRSDTDRISVSFNLEII